MGEYLIVYVLYVGVSGERSGSGAELRALD